MWITGALPWPDLPPPPTDHLTQSPSDQLTHLPDHGPPDLTPPPDHGPPDLTPLQTIDHLTWPLLTLWTTWSDDLYPRPWTTWLEPSPDHGPPDLNLPQTIDYLNWPLLRPWITWTDPPQTMDHLTWPLPRPWTTWPDPSPRPWTTWHDPSPDHGPPELTPPPPDLAIPLSKITHTTEKLLSLVLRTWSVKIGWFYLFFSGKWNNTHNWSKYLLLHQFRIIWYISDDCWAHVVTLQWNKRNNLVHLWCHTCTIYKLLRRDPWIHLCQINRTSLGKADREILIVTGHTNRGVNGSHGKTVLRA